MPRTQRVVDYFRSFPRVGGGRTPPRTRPRLEALETRALPSGSGAAAAYAQLPLSFEANRGQTDPSVNFLSRGAGYTLFLTPAAAVLSLAPGGAAPPDAAAPAVLRMQLVGGDPNAPARGQDLQAGVSNYLVGDDPSQWHAGVAHYGRVEYQNVYAGVNLDYYGDQRQLEYDFVVAAGADPGVIRLAFRGAGGVALDGRGDLVLHTSAGDVVERAPVLYQDGPAGRQAVAGRYLLEGPGEVGFQVGAYDPGRPLVIDPVLGYSTYLGGSGNDLGYALAVDASGNVYLTGYTTSTDFPTLNPIQAANAGGDDVFVTKLSPTGNALIYSTYLGGSGNDVGQGIAVDGAGNAYVTGYTSSKDFPLLNAFQKFRNGPIDAFLSKLNPSGTALVFSTYLGGQGSNYGYGIAVDKAKNIYLDGYTNATNFPVRNALQPASGGGNDAFVVEMASSGKGLVFSTYLGGSGDDYALGLALDGSGDVYVTGLTYSTNFPVANPLQAASAGGGDGFVAELHAGGGSLVYSTYLGGTGYDVGTGIAVDSAGEAYVAGYTSSTDFPTANAFQAANAGTYDAFVVKLATGGTSFVYSTYLGGNLEDYATGITVDGSGDAFVTGYTYSPDFPTANALQAANAGGDDAFVSVLNPAGSALIYSTYLGGSGGDAGYAIAVDSSGNAYVPGFTTSTNFPTTNPFQAANAGGYDAFVAKIANPIADLQVVSNSALNSILAGARLTYTITVTNNGPNNAPGVTLTDALDPHTTFVSASAPAGWTINSPPVGSSGNVDFLASALAPRHAVKFTVVVLVTPGTTGGTVLSNTATITSQAYDPNTGNNSQTAMTTVIQGNSPRFWIGPPPEPSAGGVMPNAAPPVLPGEPDPDARSPRPSRGPGTGAADQVFAGARNPFPPFAGVLKPKDYLVFLGPDAGPWSENDPWGGADGRA